MDLDLRPTDWSHPKAFGLTLRTVLPFVDVLIGTEEEFYALLAPYPDPVVGGSLLSDGERGLLEGLIGEVFANGVTGTIVLKRGPRGSEVISDAERVVVPGFPVEVLDTVGAGDAFASGLIWSRLQGKSWYESCRFGNACGALVVTRHGCAVALPNRADVIEFARERGGL
jgi:5-dehydro-2-deoxygluconokinase